MRLDADRVYRHLDPLGLERAQAARPQDRPSGSKSEPDGAEDSFAASVAALFGSPEPSQKEMEESAGEGGFELDPLARALVELLVGKGVLGRAEVEEAVDRLLDVGDE